MPSEVEKLLNLLAEAREYIDIIGGPAGKRIVARIDAALAEPKPEPKKKAERVAVIVKEFPLDWGSLVLRVGEEIELDDTNFVGPDGLHHCIGFKAYVVVPHSYFEVRHVQ